MPARQKLVSKFLKIFSTAVMSSFLFVNRCPPNYFLILGKRRQSLGARSDEYGEYLKTSQWKFSSKLETNCAVCGRALSCSKHGFFTSKPREHGVKVRVLRDSTFAIIPKFPINGTETIPKDRKLDFARRGNHLEFLPGVFFFLFPHFALNFCLRQDSPPITICSINSFPFMTVSKIRRPISFTGFDCPQ